MPRNLQNEAPAKAFHLKPLGESSCSHPSPPAPHPKLVSSSLKQEQSALKGEMGIGQGEGSGEMRLSSEKCNETKSV